MPLVAVVGRPNVGKSTLVNRLVSKGDAIVESKPGVTRDRNYFTTSWRRRDFRIVDTGGLDPIAEEELTQAIGKQAMQGVEESDLVLFVVDATQGITGGDEEVAEALRHTGKPVILIVNKVDNQRQEDEAIEWYSLGMGEPWPISATHGRNIGDLLDAIVEGLPEGVERVGEEETQETVVAIIGKPNVGKSTLFNRLLQEERSIMSEIPGTTRDAIDTIMQADGKTYRFIDTAGWRRRSKVHEEVEFYSLVRVWRAIDRSQVVILVIDGEEGVTEQDQKIAARIKDDGRACVVLLNKWDTLKGTGRGNDTYLDAGEKLQFIGYSPILRVSALTGAGVPKLLPAIDRVKANWEARIPTSQLNQLLHEVLSKTPPPSKRGKRLQIYYLTQARTAPPQFVFFVNRPSLADPGYERFLERKIRENFDFEGAPIRIALRARRRRG
ncbi:MAG: ribosome biogenesis GTPase Der [Candidatus Solincola sediminis]|uniref:GTPase Der n=1 Tax=Candidatus Solincola sediminis TaxID=1797199 RepID=A0A1F2WU82_9ACTN|nr:MAG: ribosome biogenesis GTPase Der [Candidatus Solincola sediminis]